MRGQIHGTGSCVLACVAVMSAAALGGLAAGFAARPNVVPDLSAVVADMSPAETVGLRFPADAVESAVATASAAPVTMAFASADGAISFNPRPIAAAMETSSPEPEATANPVPVARTAAVAPAKEEAARAPAKVTAAAATSKPASTRRSNAVLNDAQIASIRKRLNLSRDQERYWPAVEAELRKMEYKRGANGKSTQGTRMAQVDMSRVDVEGLKSAGFPLVMSFNDDQRRELKSLAHLLGLESVMAGL
jgi:hypothetical protein